MKRKMKKKWFIVAGLALLLVAIPIVFAAPPAPPTTVLEYLDRIKSAVVIKDVGQANTLMEELKVEAGKRKAKAKGQEEVILEDVINEMGHWQEHLPYLLLEDPYENQYNNLLQLIDFLREEAYDL